MKLQQIDNTLYIIEGENKYRVSEELEYYLVDFCATQRVYDVTSLFIEGIDITELKDRIEIRDNEAFLLPEKSKAEAEADQYKELLRKYIKHIEIRKLGNYRYFIRSTMANTWSVCNHEDLESFIKYYIRL